VEVSQIQKTIFKIELKFHWEIIKSNQNNTKKFKSQTKQHWFEQVLRGFQFFKYRYTLQQWFSKLKKRWRFSKIIELILTQVIRIFFKAKNSIKKDVLKKCQFLAGSFMRPTSYLKFLKSSKP
jgi:hypothetical protein